MENKDLYHEVLKLHIRLYKVVVLSTFIVGLLSLFFAWILTNLLDSPGEDIWGRVPITTSLIIFMGISACSFSVSFIFSMMKPDKKEQ